MRHTATATLFGFLLVSPAAAQTAPTITSFTIDHGAAETTSDAVTLRFTYTNPDGVGLPIAQYRLRYKSPTQAGFFPFGQWLTGPQGMPTLAMTLARTGSAPIPGEHRYQLQLRDSRGTISATAEARIRRVVPAAVPAPVLLGTYRVTGSEVAQAVRLARQRGFQFAALPGNGNSRCGLEHDANQVLFEVAERTVGIEFPKPTCRFRLFEGQTLQPRWHLSAVELEPPAVPAAQSSWVFERPLKPSGPDASFVLYAALTQIRGPIGPNLLWVGTGMRQVKAFVLQGPIGRTWRQAFEP